MVSSPVLRALLLGTALVTLAACDSAEERAAKHYQSALELIEEGKNRQAVVELRNVFVLDENNPDALRTYAMLSRKMGNATEAYTAWTRLAEIDPASSEPRLELTEMAILAQNWEEAERHGSVLLASETRPDRAEIADLALRFREAARDDDAALVRELTEEAAQLSASYPEDAILIRILVEGYSREGRYADAISAVERGIAADPDERVYWLIKSQLLNQAQEREALKEHLRAAVEQFPTDEEQKGTYLRFLIQTGDIEQAEQFLRDSIDTAAEPVGQHVSLVALIRRTRGDDAALEEIETALARHDDAPIFKALRAGIRFDRGERDEAISEMQAVLDSAEPGEETDRYKVTLARMLTASDNEVGARQLIEEVIAHDPSQVDALKMSAEWLIEADQPDEAIARLRTALDSEPEDAEAMTLMAQAHRRNGNPELAQDLLSLAVEASGNAPTESLRFARLLVEEGRFRPAEDVLVTGLRRTPGDVGLLTLLGEVYLATEEWARATQVEDTLRKQDTETTRRLADELRLRILSLRDGREVALGYLQGLADSDEVGAAARIGLIRAAITDGENDKAIELAQSIVDEFPDNPDARVVLGSTYLAIRDFEQAEAVFRTLLEEDPGRRAVWVQLVRALSAQGRRDDALAVVDSALEANPDAPNLLWAKASFLEQANDIDGAIAIYEEMYEANPNVEVIANNLASLLATYREDEASLERAWTVARRLRKTEVPPFQDTYGWIAFRRGDVDEALEYLEPAAARLGQDPIVQYHLGRAYEAAGRTDDAINAYRRAVDLVNAQDPREQIADARARIDILGAADTTETPATSE